MDSSRTLQVDPVVAEVPSERADIVCLSRDVCSVVIRSALRWI